MEYSWEDTYANPDTGNIRYRSSAKESIGGWAYVFTQDPGYVNALSVNHAVQVKIGGLWQAFDGYLPGSDETQEVSGFEQDDDSED